MNENIKKIKETLDKTHPELCKEWNYEKNGEFRPENATYGIGKAVWWKCLKDNSHIWEQTINHRTATKSGCPCCSGHKVCSTNNFLFCFPELSKEWNFSKNAENKPEQFYAFSHKKAWWTCKNDNLHVWYTEIRVRAMEHGCPFCLNTQPCYNNNLLVCLPEIAKQFHPTLNAPFKPEDFLPKTNKIIWWMCPNNSQHVWKTAACNMIGCPHCLLESRSLQTLFPELSKEWNYDLNVGLKPEQVYASSTKKVWWTCKNDLNHFYISSVANRAYNKSSCTHCCGRFATKINNLSIKFPEIVKEWDFELNVGLLPTDFTPNSSAKIWWRCSFDKEHSWQATINDRVGSNSRAGTRCPICCGKVISPTNNLEYLFPAISKEWHPSLNKDKTPCEFAAHSNKKAWWQCLKNKNHIWYAEINTRTSGSGCAKCSLLKNEKLALKFCEFLLKDFDVISHFTIKRSEVKKLIVDIKIEKDSKVIFVEYNGTQHYEPVNFSKKESYNAEEALIKQQERDQWLRDYCKENNIILIEVDGRNYKGNNIKYYLENKFKELKLL
jgi:hypothetical protein